jgi:hypothetical protein
MADFPVWGQASVTLSSALSVSIVKIVGSELPFLQSVDLKYGVNFQSGCCLLDVPA